MIAPRKSVSNGFKDPDMNIVTIQTRVTLSVINSLSYLFVCACEYLVIRLNN